MFYVLYSSKFRGDNVTLQSLVSYYAILYGLVLFSFFGSPCYVNDKLDYYLAKRSRKVSGSHIRNITKLEALGQLTQSSYS